MITQDLDLDILIDLMLTESVNLEEYFSSSPTGSSPVNNPTQSVKKGDKRSKRPNYYRKPCYKPAFIPAIRILKRDIRRKYIEMINNVMNAHDNQLFSSFIDDFYRPECISIHYYPDSFPSCFKSIRMEGVDVMKYMHAMNTSILPDSVTEISNVQICKRLNENGSRIIGKFQLKATAIYLPKVHEGNVVDKNDDCIEYHLYLHSMKQKNNSQKNSSFIEDVQIAAKPMKMYFSGTFEMILDENHRFVSVGIFCNDLDISS